MVRYGANKGYWTDFINLYIQKYGLDRTGAIYRFIDLMKQAGFNHIRQELITSDLANEWMKTQSVRAHQIGMTFGLQCYVRHDPWGGESGWQNGLEQAVRQILNIDGEGDAMTNDEVQAVNHYEADTIDIFNEPMGWDWLTEQYNAGAQPWFAPYVGMSNPTDYYNKYIAWCTKTVAALRAARRNLLIIIDPLPFWDTRPISANPIRGADIAYSLHIYYSLGGAYPPTWEQWARDYWDGKLAAAKSGLYTLFDTQYHGPLVRAGCRPYMEELGANWNVPNWQQFMQDIMDYNKQYGFNVHAFDPYPRSTCGLLNSEWELSSPGGQFVTNYLAGIHPTPLDFTFPRAYQQGTTANLTLVR